MFRSCLKRFVENWRTLESDWEEERLFRVMQRETLSTELWSLVSTLEALEDGKIEDWHQLWLSDNWNGDSLANYCPR
jgi:hypothetical protein